MLSPLTLFLALTPALLAPVQGEPAAAVDPVETEFSSAMLGPVYLGEEPPELRTLAVIRIDPATIPNQKFRDPSNVTPEQRADMSMVLAGKLIEKLNAGEDWYELASVHSATNNRASGSVMGTVSKGLLAPEFDEFLFSSEIGAISGPIQTELGAFIMTRLDTRAGCRVIVISGNDEAAHARAKEVRTHLDTGREFKDLTEEYSSHAGSAGRGGQWSIYERGPRDSHIKLAAFRAKIGEVVGPFDSNNRLYLLQRVPVEEVDSSLAENNWIRMRSVLLSYDFAPDGFTPNFRDADEAVILAQELLDRAKAGEDLAELAAEYTDDPTGRMRFGDLGWIHRHRPRLPSVFKQIWSLKAGAYSRVMDVRLGFGFFRKEG